MSEKTVKIKLVKSKFGRIPKQEKTLRALGLTKVNQTVEKVDNPAIRGMIMTVRHLVEIEE